MPFKSSRRLSRIKQEGIEALLSHATTAEAARAIGRSPETMYRWLREDPEFIAEYAARRRAIVLQAGARLQGGTGAMATVMLRTAVDPKAPFHSRLRAAEDVYDYALKTIELEDHEVRISALEKAKEASEAADRLRKKSKPK